MAKDLFGNKINTKDPFALGLEPTKNPDKRRPIDKNTRNAVWFKYMGNKVEGKCYCCKIRPIHITDFQVGHDKAVAKGGKDNISNLRPICGSCNRGMKTMSIEKYKKKYFGNETKPIIISKSGNANKLSSDIKAVKDIFDQFDKTKRTNTSENTKATKQEKQISKQELLNKLSREKLIKIAEKLGVCSEMERFVYEKESYVNILSSSKKVTVEKIKEILGK